MKVIKKATAILLAGMTALIGRVYPCSADTVKGDLNNDGSVSVADVVLLCRLLSEGTSLAAVALQWDTMDMDSDGMLTVSDVMCILKMIDPPAPPSDDGGFGDNRPDWGDDNTDYDQPAWGHGGGSSSSAGGGFGYGRPDWGDWSVPDDTQWWGY